MTTAKATPTAIPSNEEQMFVLLQSEPIIQAGDGGEWADRLHNPGAIVYYDGLLHMFRNGYQSLPGNAVIGYATSPDGITWTHYPDNPVLSTEDVPYGGIMIMASSVTVTADGTWALYFLIWDTPETLGAIGRATAPAPTGPWTPDPAPVLVPGPPGGWDAAQVTQPSVLPNGDGFVMYYTGVDAAGVERIGLATSPDGRIWTRYDDPDTTDPPYQESDPVLQPGLDGEWDVGGAARGRVVVTPQGFLMVYRSPATGSGFNYGLALSHDGFHWHKLDSNPFLERSDIPGAAGLWFPALVQVEDKSYFFIESFAGTSRIHLLQLTVPAAAFALAAGNAIPSVSGLAALDVANEGNAADIEVRFQPDPFIGEGPIHHVIVTMRGETLDRERALALGANRAARVEINSTTGGARLPADLLAADGSAISEGVDYDLYVLSESPAGAILSEPAPTTLANEATVRTLVAELPSATGGLALGPDGFLYAANIGPALARTGEEIYRISPAGDVKLWASGGGLRGASGNSFDSAGNLIQSSFSGDTIHRITPDGTVTELAAEGVRGPVGVTIDSQGDLYVANCRGRDILRIMPAGETTVLAEGSLFNCPNGITQDEAGNLYVANFGDGRVIKVTLDGDASELARLPGGNNGHLIYANGLLFVVARGDNRIYSLSPAGDLAPFAGSGVRGHDDGPALEATFSLPNDIVVDASGRRLFVNEVLPTTGSSNVPSRIRVIELPRTG